MATFESLSINGKQVDSLSINGREVKDLFINGKQVKPGVLPAPTVEASLVTGKPLTIKFVTPGNFILRSDQPAIEGYMELVAYHEGSEEPFDTRYASNLSTQVLRPFYDIDFVAGDTVEIKNILPFYDTDAENRVPVRFEFYNAYDDVEVHVYGNIANTVADISMLSQGMFEGLFKNSTSVTLAAISLSQSEATCSFIPDKLFADMFNGCTNLASAYVSLKVMDQTTLGESVFEGMFCGCKSLRANALANQTGEEDSVRFAFSDRITDAGANCFKDLFNGCSSLTRVSFGFYLISETISGHLFDGTFRDCSKLTFVSIPRFAGASLSIADGAFAYTFAGCLLLVDPMLFGFSDPTIVVGYAGDGAFTYMYKQCISLCNCYQPCFLGSVGSITLGGDSQFKGTFSGANQVEGSPLFDSVVFGITSPTANSYVDMFKNCTIGTVVYPSSYQTDATFTGMTGSPKFGAYKIGNIRYVG